ncbi:hypothetical protein [Pseudobdellovibrio exovorus]|uniref:Uncharacterized protein n=1 Tax=Pseudobdellovibrio exovorus JSS TaxID=1184267 RepID=M4V523_9BACT|nr:hypothetical protein [Pseudobdellovibrio exovorus]AGH94283.1 hypothetical protein A11Q_63 [Pseudobdellovibrio exovorus JSS]
MNWMKKLGVLCAGLYLVGCQTSGYMIEESNYSVKQHRIAITQAMGPINTVSANGRELTSVYHDRSLKNIEVTPKVKERYYTKAIILGPRRPYRVSVVVKAEERDPDTGRFMEVGIEEDLSRRRALSILQMLNQSPAPSGIFDEEMPF